VKYLLDTNTVIYFFKGLGNISKNLLTTPPNQIAIPTIVLFELELGIQKSKSPKKFKGNLKEFTSAVSLVALGEEEARSAAKVRARLENKGLPIGPYEILISGCALANNLILVTHNVKEFSRIKDLKLEDWYI
jgi:tRNA(fMet)-specific endonuclease VapC